MTNRILSFCLMVMSLVSLQAQDDIRFTVTVSSDSVLMGNPFQVQFTLENAEVRDFMAPAFSPDFVVVSGPNQSTSLTMINGQTRQTVTYSYLLEPVRVGSFFIEPAAVETDLGFLETSPIEILVVPNPDGIKQPIRSPFGTQEFRFGDPNDVFNSDFFRQFEWGDFEDFMKPFGKNFGFEEGTPMDPDSLMRMMPGFPFDWKMDSLSMPFGGRFFYNFGTDSLQTVPFGEFFKSFDVEELKKMFPNLPEEYWQQLDPALRNQKKKRKTYKM